MRGMVDMCIDKYNIIAMVSEMQVIETTFESLFDRISIEENVIHQLDQEYFQKKPIEIQNESGDWCPVVGLITKKDRLRVLKWSDGSITECADKHWIRVQETHCRLAAAFKVGDEIVRADGVSIICMSNELSEKEETFYDLQIDTPSHLYQTADGIVHHNTLLAQTIARMLDVPFAIADATSLTEAGYVGDDVESIITRLLQAADNDPKKAERGIVFLDEIDKKRTKGEGGSSTRDVSGEGVQQALLKLLEGSEILVPPSGSKKNPNTEMIKINTRNILFIVGGAFVGLDKVVERSMAKEGGSIGFGSGAILKNSQKMSELLRKVEPDHLVTYGLIPELVGRLPVFTALDELTEEQLVRVLTEPKNAIIKQFRAMFKLDGVDLQFDDDALMAVAKIAKKRKTGGRALRSVIEGKLMRTQFNLPDFHKNGAHSIIVHAATFNNDEQPEIVYTTNTAVV